MDRNPVPDPELTAFEQRLAAWKPAHEFLDHDRMLFEAGRASAQSAARSWRTATFGLALAVAALALSTTYQHHRHAAQTHALEAELVALQTRVPVDPSPGEESAPPAHSLQIVVERDSYFDLTRRLASDDLLERFDQPEPARSGHETPKLERLLQSHDTVPAIDL